MIVKEKYILKRKKERKIQRQRKWYKKKNNRILKRKKERKKELETHSKD